MNRESLQSAAIHLVRGYYNAFARHDRDAVERVLAADFRFTSPHDNELDRAAYFARCWPGAAQIGGYAYIHMAVHADVVFVTYECRTVDGKRFRNTEIAQVRDEEIIAIEVYFGWSIPHPGPPQRGSDD